MRAYRITFFENMWEEDKVMTVYVKDGEYPRTRALSVFSMMYPSAAITGIEELSLEEAKKSTHTF